MPKFYWIQSILPYIGGIVTYIILKILQKKGRLKKFDRFMWSPFVAAGMVFLILLTAFIYYKEGVSFIAIIIEIFKGKNINSTHEILIAFAFVLYVTILLSQFLWLSLIFQILAITKNSKNYLNIAIFFVWISVLPPIILEIFVGAFS